MTQYGIDMSEYQTDPAAVIRQYSPAFVVLKLTEGASYRVAQGWLQAAVTAARTAGAALGFYHFGRVTSGDLANFLGALRDIPGGLQPADALVLDYEIAPVDAAWAKSWLDGCRRETGRTPLFYSYPDFIQQLGGPPVGFPLWLAHYDATPAMPYALWQYTDRPVDFNRFDGADVGLFFASLNSQGGKVYGVVINNDTDFGIARDTLHLGLGMQIYDPTSGKDLPAKIHVGAAQPPPTPWTAQPKTNHWLTFTGRGPARTRAQLEWLVKAIQAAGPPPTD